MQEFFQDLDKWEEKCKTLNESGNFLIEVVQEPIAADIKNKVLLVVQIHVLRVMTTSQHV